MIDKYNHYKNCAEGCEFLSSQEEKSLLSQFSMMAVCLIEAIKCLLHPDVLSWIVVLSVILFIALS